MVLAYEQDRRVLWRYEMLSKHVEVKMTVQRPLYQGICVYIIDSSSTVHILMSRFIPLDRGV